MQTVAVRRAALRTMPVQPWYLTVATSLAEPDFSYVDPETLEPRTTSADNTSLSAQLATPRRGTWWSLGYTQRTTHRPQLLAWLA